MAELRNVYVAFALISLGGLLFGYIIGINSEVVTKGQLLCPDGWTGPVGTWTSVGYHQCYESDVWHEGLLSSLNLVGAILSSLFCFRFGDTLGRKRELRIGAALYFVGATVAAAAPVRWAIYVGLLVYGLGIGFSMHAAPMYIAEISPAEARGTLVSAKEAVIILGIFAGFATGSIFSGYERAGWRAMVAIAAIIASVFQFGTFFLHRSPRWLVLQAVRRGGLLGPEACWMEEARASLQFYRHASHPEEVEQELQSIRCDAAGYLGEGEAGFFDVFKYPKPLFIGCNLVFLQQVTGQPSVLYFATNVFKDAGFASLAASSALLVGFVKLLATLFTVWRVDLFGRRQLLMLGISLMALALTLLGTAFLFRDCAIEGTPLHDCPQDQLVLPQHWAGATMGALMLYVTGYQVGFGPISWLIISEIFPLDVRGAALSSAALVNFSSNLVMNLCQVALMRALTPAGLFFCYLALTVASFVFVKCTVPETKGETLEAIERDITARRNQIRLRRSSREPAKMQPRGLATA